MATSKPIENPIDGLFEDVEKILNFMVVKNQNEADKYETSKSRNDAAMYINAVLYQDTFFMYHSLYTIEMFQQINPTAKLKDIDYYLHNIYDTPEYYREPLRKKGREIFIKNYVEPNNYYRKLAGLPPYGTKKEDFVYLPATLASLWNIPVTTPVHELSETDQNKLLVTKEFQFILQQNSDEEGNMYPDKEYLKFLGVNSIPLVISRRARDFELIRYVPHESSNINPYLLKSFGILYNQYRDYVMLSLYNKQFEDIVVGYREFMQSLIVCLCLMQISPRTLESCISKRFFDDRIIQIIMEMYSIPKNAVISKDVRRRLVVMLNKMIQRKATNRVFYDILDVLGYEDTTISKFLFVKQQEYTSEDDGSTAIWEENTRLDKEANMNKPPRVDMYNAPKESIIYYTDDRTRSGEIIIYYQDWLDGNIDRAILKSEQFQKSAYEANWRTKDDNNPMTTFLPKYVSEWEFDGYSIIKGLHVVVDYDETMPEYGNNNMYQSYVYFLKEIEYPNLEKYLKENRLPSQDVYGNPNVPQEYIELTKKGGKLIWSKGQPRYIPKTNVYFQSINLKEYNPYEAMITGKATEYDPDTQTYKIIPNGSRQYEYNEITSGDPRWWELPDVQALVRGKDYTTADSKFIMVDTIIDQTQMLFETVYFIRMILDNKENTDDFLFTIPEIFGTELVSLFDALLYILAAMCESQKLDGVIITNLSGLLACAGFNFDLDMSEFENFLRTTKWVDTDRVRDFLSNISMKEISDINRIFNELILPLKDWLTVEMSRADNKDKFLEYEKLYRSIFCYDAARPIFNEDWNTPEDEIKQLYEISNKDYYAFKAFYPHWPDRSTKDIDLDMVANKNVSGYYPFLPDPETGYPSVEYQKTYYFTIPGYNEKIYLYDILNSPDLRYNIDADGNKTKNPIFWPTKSEEESNQPAATIYGPNGLLAQIDELDVNHLMNAYFKMNTSADDGNYYEKGDPLPTTIRSNFKQILKSKVEFDYDGWAEPPKTYKEYLKRKAPRFYDLLKDYEYDRDSFYNKLMSIVRAIEQELDFRLKYFDRFVGGDALFYEPLILLIRYFKSIFVDFAASAIQFIIKDKFDAGGNSNMIKLFDQFGGFVMTLHGLDEKAFGLFDSIENGTYKSIPNDHLGLTDFMKVFINGKEETWLPGQPNTGFNVIDKPYEN